MQNLQQALDRYRIVAIFLTLVVIISIVFVTICYTARGVMRQSANDPQVEVTDQVASIIRQGAPLDQIISAAEQVDLGDSQALFVMIFDKDKKLVGTSATLNGQPISIPDEAFDRAKAGSDYRFTREPQQGSRFALVVKAVDDSGYVVAGRSLAEMEKRATNLYQPLWIGWVLSVLAALFLASLMRPLRPLAIIEETNVTVVEEPTE